MRVRSFSYRSLLPALFAGGLTASAAAQETAKEAKRPDVHFVPTPYEVVDSMLAIADVKKSDRLFDLGSGDGRIVIAAAKRHGTRGVGIDIDPERIKESRANAKKAGVTDKVEFRQADLFETDLSKASVVTLYLLPQLNLRLRPKIYRELQPGSRIASHAFDMGSWEPDTNFTVGYSGVYYWVVPANVGGEWSLTAPGGRQYTLSLTQKFQKVEGKAQRDGQAVKLESARVRGDSVTISLADGGSTLRLQGLVDGGSMSGAIGGSGTNGNGKWTATRKGPAPKLGQETED